MSPWEFLLCPAVGFVPRVRRGPGAVPAQVDVRLAAVLHGAAVHRLVDQAGHVRHADLGGKLVDTGGVPSLARPASTAVDDGLGGQGQVGELVTSCDLKPEDGQRVTESALGSYLSARAERVPWAQQEPLQRNNSSNIK